MPLAPHLRRGGDPIIKWTGPTSGEWNLSRGPLLLITGGTYQFIYNRTGFAIRAKAVAAGQFGVDGSADSTQSQGGGGGGGGAADLQGIIEVIQRVDYSAKIGSTFSATSTNGTDGETQFRRGSSGTLLLDLGSATRDVDHLGNTGRHRPATGGVARIGSAGKSNGGDGGYGGAQQPSGEPGTVSHGSIPGSNAPNGAGGGGGGGADSAGGNAGGNGNGQQGGPGGSPGNAGGQPATNPDPTFDGDPGTSGSGNAGGGAGPGGGAPLTGFLEGLGTQVTHYLGGGGGGGSGALTSNGSGGSGGKGGLVISLA